MNNPTPIHDPELGFPLSRSVDGIKDLTMCPRVQPTVVEAQPLCISPHGA
jgi:hypothetical protein